MQVNTQPSLHPLWRKITALDSTVFYYNPFTGRISKEGFAPLPQVQGGILSDEVSFGSQETGMHLPAAQQ